MLGVDRRSGLEKGAYGLDVLVSELRTTDEEKRANVNSAGHQQPEL